MVLIAVLGAIAAALTAACGDGGGSLKSGTVVTTEGGLDGGRIWFLWEGTKQRIYQPAGLTEDDLESLGYTVGEPVSGPLTVSDRMESTWVVYPAVGTSKLWLVYDNVMHEVELPSADAADVEPLPDAGRLIITSVRIPGD